MALINKDNLPEAEANKVKKKNTQNFNVDMETSGLGVWSTYIKSFDENNKYIGSAKFVDSLLTYAGATGDYMVEGW